MILCVIHCNIVLRSWCNSIGKSTLVSPERLDTDPRASGVTCTLCVEGGFAVPNYHQLHIVEDQARPWSDLIGSEVGPHFSVPVGDVSQAKYWLVNIQVTCYKYVSDTHCKVFLSFKALGH